MTEKEKSNHYCSLFNEQVIRKLHKMQTVPYLDDETKVTLLIQVIDEAEQLLNPIQCRLTGEDNQMELLPQ